MTSVVTAPDWSTGGWPRKSEQGVCAVKHGQDGIRISIAHADTCEGSRSASCQLPATCDKTRKGRLVGELARNPFVESPITLRRASSTRSCISSIFTSLGASPIATKSPNARADLVAKSGLPDKSQKGTKATYRLSHLLRHPSWPHSICPTSQK